MTSSNSREPLEAISLFSGAGGLDLGLQGASRGQIKFEAWVENDSDCQATLRANDPRVSNRLVDDITKVSGKDLLRLTGLVPEEAFVVSGGPPCQAFSTAGLRRSVHEARGQVLQHYLSVIEGVRPRFFVFENVRGLLSVAIKHRAYVERIAAEKASPGEPDLPDDARLGSVFQQLVIPRFERLGYEVVYGLVNSADYGTAQVRHRVLILGSREREFGSGRYRKMTGQRMTAVDLLPPTHHNLAPYPPIRRWRTLRDAIGQLPPPAAEEVFTYSEDRAKVWARIPAGSYWTYIRDNPNLFPEGVRSLLKGAYMSGGGKVGFWRRLSWDRPAPTLPTQPQHFATGLCHPDQVRPLSIPEYAALQDFPSTYTITGHKAARYEQLGNAVPVRLGVAIGSLLTTLANQKGPVGRPHRARERMIRLDTFSPQ